MSSDRRHHRGVFRTIGVRLTVWGAAITIAVSLVLCAILYAGMALSLRHEVDGFLQGEVDELTAVLRAHAPDYRASEKRILLELSHRVREDLSFRLLDREGNVLVNSDPTERLKTVAVPRDAWAGGPAGSVFETIRLPDKPYPVRVCSRPFQSPDGRTYIAQAGYLLDRMSMSLARFRRICIVALLLVVLLAVIGGRIIANRSLRPIQAMIAKATHITVKKLNERLPSRGTGDELDQLASTLNDMLAHIQRHVARLKQFTADAAHELRSPLAALRGNAEVALSHPRSESELRHVLEDSIEHYDRLARMTDDLLLLARADAGHDILRREAVRLDRVVHDVVDLYTPLARDRGIELESAVTDEIRLHGDGPRLRQLVGNLVDNAVKYTESPGRVSVSTSLIDGAAHLTIADTGVGIPPDHLPHIFDRFYRIDAARSARRGNGVGLGLSICRTIAEAHGGRLDLTSTPGTGTAVHLTLPLCPITAA
ncbi:MAG: sensor histidine kinase [Phycisphaerae bacterium]